MNSASQELKADRSEQAFLDLARRWNRIAALTNKEYALPAEADEVALACLLLASERGKLFGREALQQMDANSKLAATRFPGSGMAWIDALPWRLGQGLMANQDGERDGVGELLSNLNHSMSAVRSWVMTVAWAVRAWIPVAPAVRLLLKNVADTLGEVELALGLARGLCATDEELEAIVREYTPPKRFQNQFDDRMTRARDIGLYYFQIHVWDLELRWRQLIEEAIMGPKPAPTGSTGGNLLL